MRVIDHLLCRYRAGEYTLAAEHFTSALRSSPGDHRVLSNRAACYSRLGKCQRCIQVTDELSILSRTVRPASSWSPRW